MFKIDHLLMENWTDEFLEERLELPRVWKVLDNGFEIHELKTDKIDEVVEIIKEEYIFEDPLLVGCQMHKHDESVEQYLNLARHWMMDTLSTVAVEQETGNIVGFIICRFNELNNNDPAFSKERIYSGETWIELQKFVHYLTKNNNAYEKYNVNKVFEVYSWFVRPKYRNKGIGRELLKNVILRQLPEFEWFEINVVTGVFTGKVSQKIAQSLGMETLYEYSYDTWTISENKDMFFYDITPGNYKAKVMSVQLKRPKTFKKARKT